jgi:hypothetical protein
VQLIPASAVDNSSLDPSHLHGPAGDIVPLVRSSDSSKHSFSASHTNCLGGVTIVRAGGLKAAQRRATYAMEMGDDPGPIYRCLLLATVNNDASCAVVFAALERARVLPLFPVLSVGTLRSPDLAYDVADMLQVHLLSIFHGISWVIMHGICRARRALVSISFWRPMTSSATRPSPRRLTPRPPALG